MLSLGAGVGVISAVEQMVSRLPHYCPENKNKQFLCYTPWIN